LSEERLLWAVLCLLMRQGYQCIEKEYPTLQERDTLYDGALGTNYGIANDKHDGEYGCNTFAGYSAIDENYYASGADFSILPEKNRYFNKAGYAAVKEKIYQTVSGQMEPEFLILTAAEETVNHNYIA